eukprot:g1075.t1
MRYRPQSAPRRRDIQKSLALKQAYGISALEEVREQDSADRAENEFPWDDVAQNEGFGATQQLLSTPAPEVVRLERQQEALVRHSAASRIQAAARGKNSRRREWQLRQETAAATIQSAGRGWKARRRHELIAEKRSRMLAAREEQRNLREYYMARINRSEAETVAAQTLQAHIRSYNVRKTIRNRDASVLLADGSAMKLDEEEEKEGGEGEEEVEEDNISDSTMQALILRMGVQIKGHGFAIVSVSEVQPSSASAKMFCFTMYSVPEAHIRSAMYNLPRHLAHANESTLPVTAHANRNHNGNGKTDMDSDHQWEESTGKKTDLGEHAGANHQSSHDTSPTKHVGQADFGNEALPTLEMDISTIASEIIAGGVGGAFGTLCGQPFDTVKVRLQSYPSTVYSSSWACAVATYRMEGIKGLFRGTMPPVIGSAIINAVVFASYGQSIGFLQSLKGKGEDSRPSLGDIYLAGSVAGFCQTFVLVPADFIKCNLQVIGESTGNIAVHSEEKPLTLLRNTLRDHGLRRVFQGFGVTSLREIPSYGLYFSIYHKGKSALTPAGSTEAPAYAQLIAGGLAGMVSWASIYPIDVAKTNIQTLPADAPKREFSTLFQLRTVLREKGMLGMYRGIETTMLRAFIVNAATFYVYESVFAFCK